MPNEVHDPKDAHEMSDLEVRKRIISLGFGGDERLFIAFYRKLQQGLPEGTGIVLRGSVVTNKRHEDGRPFDADGRGSSDLDVTLVGNKVMESWGSDAFYIPGLHTKPLCDKDPTAAPSLDNLRTALQELVGRPVNFQATANLVLYARDVLFGDAYYIVVPPGENA
ncbi:MAG TPA: hypothetical protein VE135_23110 [Pyrinomonadaceae bacterium]|nr:hypothetical protein [Pyrinomonadaceae bacterium]